MPTMKKYILPFILLLGLLLTACGAQPSGGEEAPWQTALRQTGEYLLAQDAPSAGPVNGDWTVVGLRAAGLLERETAAVYYESVVEYTAQAEGNRLNPNKPTENTRTILGVTAAGHNAADVAGVDLTAGLGDMAYLRHQGLNASVWALIALDCGAYPDPAPTAGAEPVTRAALVAELLKGPADPTLKSPFPKGTALLSAEQKGTELRVDLSAAYSTLSGVGLSLADYAITLTLTQLPDVARVRITVAGRELDYRSRQVFLARDILTVPKEDVVGTVDASLYFVNGDGALTAEARTLNLYEGDTQVSAVMRALENGPGAGAVLAVAGERGGSAVSGGRRTGRHLRPH